MHVTYTPPVDNGLDILWQDESLLVVNKPAGLLTVPGRGAEKGDCLISRVQREFPDALVVHRLDMDTSGLVLLARGAQMQRSLSGLFRERRVSKRYMAIVQGYVQPTCGEVELPINRDWPNRPLQRVDIREGKHSLTRFRLLQHLQKYAPSSPMNPEGETEVSRIELEPITGRTHQLRVHMAAIGHPILGDRLYGTSLAADRLMLHAGTLEFVHPRSGVLLSLVREQPF